MIRVIDRTTKLKGNSKDPLDLNNAVNQLMSEQVNAIKKRIESIDTDEDVTVEIVGTKDNIEVRSNASDELKERIQRVIRN